MDLNIVGRTHIWFRPEIEVEARTMRLLRSREVHHISTSVEVEPARAKAGRLKSRQISQGQGHWRLQNGDRKTSCTDQSDTQGEAAADVPQSWIHPRFLTKNRLYLISCCDYYLVGGDWSMAFIFPSIGNHHHPRTSPLIFFRGVETQPPTSYWSRLTIINTTSHH